jgi:hypothetical protein
VPSIPVLEEVGLLPPTVESFPYYPEPSTDRLRGHKGQVKNP